MTEDTYYGFSLYYRMERRATGNVIILAYKEQKKTKYEHPPRQLDALPAATEKQTALEWLPRELMEDFFRSLLGLQSSRCPWGKGLRLRAMKLPLAALLAADTWELFTDPKLGHRRSTVQDDLRAIDLLRVHEGSTPWDGVTPKKCAPWMTRLSHHAQTGVKRVMHTVFLYQMEAGCIDQDPWHGYVIDPARDSADSPGALIRSQIDPTVLTDGQCRELLAPIERAVREERVSSVDMALLLHLTLALPLEEICALKIRDFGSLQDFPARLTVNITHISSKEGTKKNYKRVAITEPQQVRKLPLATFVREAFEAHKKVRGNPAPGRPLVPAPANRTLHMRPDNLRKALEKRLEGLPLQKKTAESKRKRSDLPLLERTAPRELLKCGMEEEELRFLQGKRPMLVSAKSYADHMNESELNKLGAIQDRWLGRLLTGEASTREKAKAVDKLSKRGDERAYRTTDGSRTQR